MRILLIAGLAIMLGSAYAESGGDGPPVTREAVQEILAQEKDGWARKLSGRPRLYFSETTLPALKESWLASTGKKRQMLDAAVNTAKRIARAPVPAYIDPDKAANPWYARNELWQRDVGDSIVALTFGSLLEKDPQMDAKLRDLVLSACRYPTWGRVGPNIDLACAHLARGVAVAWDLRPDLWTEEDRTLITSTISERVHALLEGNYGRVAWARGYNENHHHVALAALGLCGVAFFHNIPEAPEWLAAAIAGLRNTAKYACADGSSPEGVPYWSYSLLFTLQLLEGLRPTLDVEEFYRMPMLAKAVAYRMNSSAPGLASVVPWGDAVSRDFYGPQPILYRLASQYQDASAQWLAQELPFAPQGSIDVPLWAFLWYDETMAAEAPTSLDHLQTVGNVVTMRDGWSDGDILFSIKAGYTNRNHSHLDAGALALSIGDEWLMTTPGYGEGRHNPDFWKTDGPRWEYLSNATESHSTLVIDGKNQRFDHEAQGVVSWFSSLPGWAWADVDLTEAYSGVTSADRSVLHRRGEYFLVNDSVRAPQSVRVEWLAQAGKKASVGDGVLTITGDNGEVALTALAPAEAFAPRKPTSAKADVPAGRLQTYAISAAGNDVDFVVFGQVARRPGPPANLKARLASSGAEAQVIEVKGAEWTDTITWSRQAAVHRLAASVDGTANAQRLVARTKDARLLDVAAWKTRSLTTLGFDFTFSEEVDLELSQVAENAWLLTLASDASGNLRWPDALRLRSLKEGSQDVAREGSDRRWEKGRYAFFSDETGLAACREKLIPKPATRSGREIVTLPAQPPLSSDIRIISEAESFVREGNGKVEIVEKAGASGTSLRGFGNESTRHWVAWKFPVSVPGKYVLKVRYCTAAESATASILIDGKAVSDDALHIPFPATGGWSNGRSNWQDRVLSGGNGQAIVLELSAGEHEIVLTDPSAAINLDALELIGTGREAPGNP